LKSCERIALSENCVNNKIIVIVIAVIIHKFTEADQGKAGKLSG